MQIGKLFEDINGSRRRQVMFGLQALTEIHFRQLFDCESLKPTDTSSVGAMKLCYTGRKQQS